MRKPQGIFFSILTFLLLIWSVDAAIDAVLIGGHGFFNFWLHPTAAEAKSRILVSLILGLGLGAILLSWQKLFRPLSQSGDYSDQYISLMETTPENIVIHRHNRILFANRNTLNFFGVKNLKPFIDSSILDFIHPQFLDLISKRQEQVFLTGTPSESLEVILNMLDGTSRSVSLSSTLVDFQDEPALLTFFRDISDQVAVREELFDSRERLQLALEAAQDGVWDWDISTGKMVYSKIWAGMLGYDLEELQTDNSTWLFLIHPEDHARSNTLLEAHLRGDIPQYETEVRLRHKNGYYIWVLDRGRVVSRDENGHPVRMTGTHRNISARKEAELALEIRNRIAEIFLIGEDPSKYQLLLETVIKGTECSCGFFATLDEDQSLRVWATYRDEGSAPPALTTVRIPKREIPVFLTPVIQEHRSIILDKPQLIPALEMDFQTALLVPITNHENVIGLLMLGNKVHGFFESDRSLVESLAGYMAPILQSHLTSEMRELQLRQAQKMEALGALAGGIAHDFNNILQAIMGFSALAKDDAPVDGTIDHDLQKVLKAARRGQDLVQRILLFSRREEQEQHPVEIFKIASEAVDLISPTIPSTIEVRAQLAEDCGQVMADPSQINQIIMNLATNAFHAMENDGGVMEVGLRLISQDDHEIEMPESMKNRKVVMFWVKDTGCGIEPEELDRVFDPFYTTKEVGRGTGLGLSVVHGIVVNHGGEVKMISALGQGTTVRVFLPSLPAEKPAELDISLPSPSIAQDAHIMFVDDEEDITAIGKAMLEKQGYKVTALCDSNSALTEFQSNPNDFDLVITDLTMPHLTGLQLAEEVSKVRADLPVVLITGMGDGMKKQLEAHPHIQGIVHKPFSVETLHHTITTVMTQKPDGAH
jgi:PAS domain S-box-containing protein